MKIGEYAMVECEAIGGVCFLYKEDVEAGAYAKGGEIFVLNMGSPVKILKLAENLIKLCGYVPYKDIEIKFTGLRPGEKLYEELLIKTENLDKTENNLIFIERDQPISREEMEASLADLQAGLPMDLCSVGIEQALSALGEIDGRELGEEIVAEIFSRFCVGK